MQHTGEKAEGDREDGKRKGSMLERKHISHKG